MEEKKRRIDIREWFADLGEDDHTPPARSRPPSVEDSEAISAQMDKPTQPRSEQLLLEVSSKDRAKPISTGNRITDMFQRISWWFDRSSIQQRVPRTLLLNIWVVFLICAFLFGLIWFATIWGARDETIGGLIKSLYLLTVLAFIPYLFFLIYPLEKYKILTLSIIVLVGGVFFHLRLRQLGGITDRYPFVDQFYYYFYVLLSGFIGLLGVWIRQNWKSRTTLLILTKAIRLAYPILIIIGFALIGLVNGIF